MTVVRRAIVILLGLVLILDALTSDHFPPFEFVIGIVMVGLVPVDALIDLLTRPARDEGEVERLREVMRERPDEAG